MWEWLKFRRGEEFLIEGSAFVLTIALVPLHYWTNGLGLYRAGLGVQEFGLLAMPIPALFVLVPWIYVGMRALGVKVFAKRPTRLLSWWVLAAACIALALGNAWYGHLLRTSPPCAQYLRGYQHWVQTAIGPTRIELWSKQLSELRGGSEPGGNLILSHRPDFLDKISRREGRTPEVRVFFSPEGEPQYAIVPEGGRNMRWGLYVSLKGAPPLDDANTKFLPVSENGYVYAGG